MVFISYSTSSYLTNEAFFRSSWHIKCELAPHLAMSPDALPVEQMPPPAVAVRIQVVPTTNCKGYSCVKLHSIKTANARMQEHQEPPCPTMSFVL